MTGALKDQTVLVVGRRGTVARTGQALPVDGGEPLT